jgi:2-phospho-L-lactate guanylyltransferase
MNPSRGGVRALVPAKTLGEAKGRLSALLSTEERRRLALAMLEDVVRALTATRGIDGVSVVSPDDQALHLAAELGADPIAESANVRGLNQALKRALSAMSPQPAALLVVPGDVPRMTAGDVEQLLTALPERGIAICPSPDEGTSALAMRPPGVIPFRFGPKSSHAHVAAAREALVEAAVVKIDSLARDVDSPEDLRHLLAHPADTATHRLVADLNLAERV